MKREAMGDARDLPRNARILLLLLARVQSTICITHALKLLYFVDLFGWQVLGRPLSDLRWKFYKKGPFDAQIYDIFDWLTRSGIVEGRRGLLGGRYLTAKGGTDVDTARGGFSPGELQLIEVVASRYGTKNVDEVLRDAYATPPMRAASRGDILPMEKERDRLRIARGGLSLERILSGEEQIRRGTFVTHEELKASLAGE